MADHRSNDDEHDSPLAATIEDVARRVREAEHLEPDTRVKVADLLENLAAELNETEPSEHKELLAQTTTKLVQAVHEEHETGLIESARERLEEVVAKAEANAPVATDLALHLIELLANLGI